MLDTPENPVLAAQAQHESSSKSFIAPTSGSSRNPFAKNSPNIGPSGDSSRSEMIFDDISKEYVKKKWVPKLPQTGKNLESPRLVLAAMASIGDKDLKASEDIFATQDDDDIDMLDTPENPFLVAQARHESSSKSFITPTSGSSRNPFAKNSPAIGSSGGSSRSGLIFDDISKKDVMKSGSRAKVAFGAKKLENITPNSRTLTLTKRVDKENKMKNTNIETSTTNAGKELKKGFQLWYDENSQKVSEEENIMDEQVLTDHCLDIWKTMSKADKESYKTPRVPKRPREHDDKTSTTSSKLAKFSANPL